MSRRALLIATSHYEDPQILDLRAPREDAKGLREVLADAGIGGFEVSQCLESTAEQWRRSIGDFFLKATHDDLLLLYVSGHGMKDKPGKLYFVAADTRKDQLITTGVPASFIQEVAQAGKSRRVLLIFDTCFSGAFARGFQPKGDSPINAGEYFSDSTGTVVITASGAMQYALEDDSMRSIGQPSVFTRHVIQGLKTGEADRDGDGQITSEDLYKYVREKVHVETQMQRPQRWAYDLDGDFVVATNPRPRPAALPEDLVELIQHARPEFRQRAVWELVELARSKSAPIALAAREALKRLAADPNLIISSSAAAAFSQADGASPTSGPASASSQAEARREEQHAAEKRRAEEHAHAQTQMISEMPSRGTALLCAASAMEFAIAPTGLRRTMFSDSLLKVLATEHPSLGTHMSLSELGALVRQHLQEAFPDSWVRPEIHCPDQREGEVADVGLFPNPRRAETQRLDAERRSTIHPDPGRILAVLLGAGWYARAPRLAQGPSFENSARDFREYLIGPAGLGLPRANINWLFDDGRLAVDQLRDMGHFLARRGEQLRAAGTPATDLIVYYVGHGMFCGPQRAYHLAIRPTEESREGLTSIRVSELAQAINDHGRFLRKFLILDCGFAGAAYSEFQ